jgi:hypothetical protein
VVSANHIGIQYRFNGTEYRVWSASVARIRWVRFGAEPPAPEHERAGGDDERPAGPSERFAERLDHLTVGRRCRAGRLAVTVCQVDDAVSVGR